MQLDTDREEREIKNDDRVGYDGDKGEAPRGERYTVWKFAVVQRLFMTMLKFECLLNCD
jgi:hypothetical protein